MPFKRRRSEVAISINEAKHGARDSLGGALNFGEQMTPLAFRFTRDFVDAYARLLAADIALGELYNYTIALPPLPAPNAPYQSIFDAALVWTRQAIRFLVGFSHLSSYPKG